MSRISFLPFALLAALAATSANAQGVTATLGYENAHPSGNNGSLSGGAIDADSDWAATGSLGYDFDDHWSADVWTALDRFQHTLSQGGNDVAEIKARPITATVNYHFLPGEKFNPYVGVGYGWVDVSGEKGLGTLAANTVKANNSNGLSYVLGADVALNDTVFVRGSARKVDFKSDLSVDGTPAGRADINPWIYGLSVGFKF
jgi:outer membrane protein